MRLAIDMQGAQTSGSRNRGIGRYTLALCREMIRLRGEHEVILVLNGLLPDAIESLRATFAGDVPQHNIRVWDAAGPVNAATPANDARRRAAEKVREAFIAGIRPDIVLNTSLFEGLGDEAITSIGTFTNRLRSAAILYDLIPLIHRSSYLQHPATERWYLNKLDHLRRADLLLSISASSRQEAIEHLGYPHDQVVNISTACDSHFQPMKVDKARQAYLGNTYGLLRPYVMYTGGIDHRKNIERLIQAYAGLPQHIRAGHQLAVICSIQPHDRERLGRLAREEGLAADELIMTGFVPEADLVLLYNACKLFVFPSWHEGFGLPALEAMSCGRAVIGSDISSIPEVIGRKDALFDPFDKAATARKIETVLTNEDLRDSLQRHGLEQAGKFSWELTARRAWHALETTVSEHKRRAQVIPVSTFSRRPRLAYVSPLPAEQSGISDYSAEMLPELARHYEIDVIVAQKDVSDPWVMANCPVRDVAWFRKHAGQFDRVLYHFGNSHFHIHMFDLLRDAPGIVVLHDFFLSHVLSHSDYLGTTTHGLNRALFHDHGWPALLAGTQTKDPSQAVWTYPCNLEVIQRALGVIVHSEYSCRLAREWYGSEAVNKLTKIPLLRAPAVNADRTRARKTLGLPEEAFVVCSFGHIGPSKLNHRLLSAWLASPLAHDPNCRLVFVGQIPQNDYGSELGRTIQDSTTAGPISITGWVNAELYQAWLTAADICVQLRALSRGETSAAVFDCMNHGKATIVNANGSNADLEPDALWMLPDEFSDLQMIEALITLWQDRNRRNTIGLRARAVIHAYHQPHQCADAYARAIEHFYQDASLRLPALIDALARESPSWKPGDLLQLATILEEDFPDFPRRRQILVDISELVQRDGKTGVQRVVRSLLQELLTHPPAGWSIEPVYATHTSPGYRYARRFTSRLLSINDDWSDDDAAEAWPGDIFLGLDLQHEVVLAQKDHLLGWHRRGIKVNFIVYDLLPILLPQYYPDQARANHQRWLEIICQFDGALCISRTVADELHEWLDVYGSKRERPFALNWFHLGGDVINSVPTTGMPADAGLILNALKDRPSFLMVGTVEPRKGHAQALSAFEHLWREGVDANLVIVGKPGWMMEPVIAVLRSHPEIGSRLFWLESISDEYLEKIYAASICLIAASEGEGFGLPLIEAAQHDLPIIARDIPVFREVAGGRARYFSGYAPEALAGAVHDWLAHYHTDTLPQSSAMRWLTWKESTQTLLDIIFSDRFYKQWMPDGIYRYWGADRRLRTQTGNCIGRDIVTTGKEGYLVYGPYLALPAGSYRASVLGLRDGTKESNARVEVAIGKGATCIARSAIYANDEHGCLASVPFSLGHSVTDLEVRIFVEASDDLRISMIQIEPLPEKQPVMDQLEGAQHQEEVSPKFSLPQKNISQTRSAGEVMPKSIRKKKKRR